MESTVAMAVSLHSIKIKSTPNPFSPFPIFKTPSFTPLPTKIFAIKACSASSSSSTSSTPNPVVSTLRTSAAALIFSAAVFGRAAQLPARAEPPPNLTQEIDESQIESTTEKIPEVVKEKENSPFTQFLESNSEAVEALSSLLQKKLEAGEDEEGLKILRKLCSAQPDNLQWKFLMARLLNEMGNAQEARLVFEDILSVNPLSFEALFENAILMDRCGEGEAVLKRLEEALKIADEENKVKEARDVRFIMAQVQFLQKNVDEALKSYDELEKEDPKDFRPYFCKGMIFSLLDRNEEAREQFAMYKKLSPKKFEVEGYLRTPLSKMKLFGTGEDDEN
ncbi:OLC1v1033175C1 [Oldenlandia corymbosa var. corymbosa]|uniref:OLC1v1033175C1 n=1 Tax=Oldenlandia corymbosa var. corymbosa TaxID=529605 RepID=A0AAV1CQN7_OLDCO|nr:OLC1v1033175C1 [Oldenlandia corymbosa var. corymbosa]